ncbi:unnamed protein product, partial [Microthlaspi erraticum]
MNGFALTVKS